MAGLLRRSLLVLGRGLAECHWALGCWPLSLPPSYVRSEAPPRERPVATLFAPPPGHPERLVADVPAGAEAQLWRHLREDR
jgi:Family of unknown function (DUF6059)